MKTALLASVLLLGALSCYYLAGEKQTGDSKGLRATSALYTQWKSTHNFKFGDAENRVRLGLFQKNLQFITEHNSKQSNFTLGVNQFAGMTYEEFAATYLGEKDPGFEPTKPANLKTLKTVGLNDTVDWTLKGAVTPVKDQGQCGSCWTFSATGALEGSRVIAGKDLRAYSEQQLVDCSKNDGNSGCNGGLAPSALKYVLKNGIVQEADYPYTAKDGVCKVPASAELYRISDYQYTENNAPSHMKAVLNQQPFAISLRADKDVFRFYKSGILDSDDCGTDVNHAVLAVGYGTENGIEYWKIKNSWAAKWGDNGYIRIAIKEGKGVCGTNRRCSWATAA